jgi:hypothetical protein
MKRLILAQEIGIAGGVGEAAANVRRDPACRSS